MLGDQKRKFTRIVLTTPPTLQKKEKNFPAGENSRNARSGRTYKSGKTEKMTKRITDTRKHFEAQCMNVNR